MSKQVVFVFLIFIFFNNLSAKAQSKDSLLSEASLNECVQYALVHQPTIKQAQIDEKIINADIKTRLADWYPQIALDYSIQHYFKSPETITPTGNYSAVKNISAAYFSLNQNIFNQDVLLASRTASDVRLQSKQITANDKIYITLNVSKSFYDVLLSRQQIDLVDQDISRLDRTVKDTYNQYKAGVVDKTDYKRARISLNNAVAEKKQYQEALTAKFSVLKLLMGYPQQSTFNLVYDSPKLQSEIYIDTLQQVDYTNRIEFKILQTQQSLLQSNLKYYKWSFLPTLSAFANYNLSYANNSLGKIYSQTYSSSYIGLTLNFPIFEGGKRIWQIRGANLELDRLQYNFVSLRDSIQSEYTQALSTYKSYLNDYSVQHDNLDLANDVYNTIYLQYKAGVKTYLDVIIAESDLRTTQVNYLNALYQVLSSKFDVEKALGTLTY